MSSRRDDEARKAALDSFLSERIAEGFRVETRTDTHAIIAPPRRLITWPTRLWKGRDEQRQVISVDEQAVVTARPAEPVRW